MARVDWLDVLSYPDINQATELVTLKFKRILDQHAPWILFQCRKKYKPWITQQTIDLMKERDRWKKLATSLSVLQPYQGASDVEKEAWAKFKTLRNKVNNMKKNDEYRFKRGVVDENIACSEDLGEQQILFACLCDLENMKFIFIIIKSLQ